MAQKKVTTLSREERLAFIERTESELPLTMQTELLSLNRSSLYYQPRPPRAEEVRLKHRIDELYTHAPFYGARRIAAQMQREGMSINRKTVGRYMQEMGIAAIYPSSSLALLHGGARANASWGAIPTPLQAKLPTFGEQEQLR